MYRILALYVKIGELYIYINKHIFFLKYLKEILQAC